MRGLSSTNAWSVFIEGVAEAAFAAFGASAFFVTSLVLREKSAILFRFLRSAGGEYRERCFRILNDDVGMLKDGDWIQVTDRARRDVADVAEALRRRFLRIGKRDEGDILLGCTELLEARLGQGDEHLLGGCGRGLLHAEGIDEDDLAVFHLLRERHE